MRPSPLFGVLACAMFSTARAQDVVKVDPAHYNVEFENADVRVVRARLRAHERVAMHSHPARVFVCLTDVHLKFTSPDGKTFDFDGKAGHTGWAPAVTHTTENVSDSAGELIEIEVKGKH
jgi:hypothetical protein